jgi:Carboxypeptidase regulatory-like domain
MVGAVALRRIHSGLRALLACVIFAGMVCSLVSPAFAAGGQTGIIQGTVTDASGNPVSGAAISAASPTGSYTATTAGNGSFTIVGVNVDTYAISVSAPGYDTYVLRGATVTGDQTLTLPLKITKTQAVIGRVGARSASGAFQPSQTVDSYTITGARIAQTTGSPADSNLNDVVLSAPGVSISENGNPTIRGGSQREVGYQLDGVSFDEPFLGQNGSAGNFTGLNSVQVVEGVGDASQGGLGSGVINVIPKRGTYPATGDVVAQLGGPNFDNFIGGEYGFATADGSISNYISLDNERLDPYHGFHDQVAGPYGNFFAESYRNTTQFADNFVFKFGNSKNQSLQVLYENISELRFGNYGGIPSGTFPSDPFALAYQPFDSLSSPVGPAGLGYVAPMPYVPSTNVAVPGPELLDSIQTRFLKFEYDNSLNATTYLALRYYNWDRMDYESTEYSLGQFVNGAANWEGFGGPTVGTSFDLTHTFGDKLTVTLNGQYNVLHPVWNQIQPLFTLFTSPTAAGVGDFEPPSGGCPAGGQGQGYVYCAYGGAVQAPAFGLNENNSFFQNYGMGLRFQYAFNDKVHADFGARWEGQNQHWYNPIGNPNDVVNPFDVPTVIWGANVTNPIVWSPRAALTWQLDTDDSLRVSYGRSAVFQNSQTAGTPLGIYGNLAALAALPPNLVGATPLITGAPVANQCGTTLNGIAGTFPCANYLQQYYWSIDRGLDAPDAGGAQPSIYSNYDASYSHQFGPGGVALKITPFYKLGTQLPTAQLLLTLPGGQQVFSEASKGFNRTTGVELNVTTPDHATGLSAFLSGTYQNVLQSAPPLSNGEFNGVPQLSAATIALNDVYRAGYISPASVRIGGTWNMGNGFSVTPIVQLDSGFPYNVGNTIAGTLPDGTNANLPQVNFGAGVPILLGFMNIGGTAANTNYYDPAYSGSQIAPNIAATRGTPGSGNSGGVTWTPNVQFNLTLQYKHGRDTIGIQMLNLFTNGYVNSTPAVNPFYQPVANGLSGPQTGQNTCAATYGAARGCAAVPVNSYAFSNGAYLLTNGNVGTYQLAPLSPTVFNVFYRRQF